ncbi:hypothetical protein HispidOSU_002191 [Sigmodon hispidus]
MGNAIYSAHRTPGTSSRNTESRRVESASPETGECAWCPGKEGDRAWTSKALPLAPPPRPALPARPLGWPRLRQQLSSGASASATGHVGGLCHVTPGRGAPPPPPPGFCSEASRRREVRAQS